MLEIATNPFGCTNRYDTKYERHVCQDETGKDPRACTRKTILLI